MQELFERLEAVPEADREAFLQREESDEALRMEALRLMESSRLEQEESRARPEPAAALARPAQIGSVTISSVLGSGGFSTVYGGVRHVSGAGQQVAVKLFHEHRLGPDARRRLSREQRLLASLSHPGIVRFLDAGFTPDDQPYLVMELVTGSPITDHCDRNRLGVEARLRLIADACRALEYAHRNLIVHLDLKPSNILVSDDGQVKVLDFGTAKLMDDAGTPTVTMQLTPLYASPERLRGEPGSVSSDIYSLGLVLYELVSGAWPLGDPESMEGIAGRLHGGREPDPLGTVCTAEAAAARGSSVEGLRKILQGDLQSIAAKALAHQPSERYGSMAELLEDLRRFQAGEPVLAHPPGFLYRTRKFVTRNARTLAAATVSMALLASAAVYAWSERIQGAQRLQEARGMANYLLFDLYDRINDLPGSTSVRAHMAALAQEQIDRLSRLSGADPALRLEAAAGYDRLAEIQGISGSSSLGNTRDAAENLAQARSILEQILAGQAVHRPALIETARNALLNAKLENWNRRNPAAARPLIDKARELLERTRDESDASWLRVHASLAVQSCDFAEFERNYDEEARVADAALGELAGWPAPLREGGDWVLRRAALLKRRGNARYSQSRFPEALASYREANELLRVFDAGHPDRPEVLYSLMDMRYQMAYCFGELKQPQAMLEAARESLEIGRRLADSDRDNRALARSYSNKRQALAESLAGLARWPEAIREQEAVLAARREESRKQSDSNLAREDIAMSEATLAEILFKGGQRARACELARGSLERSRSLHSSGSMTERTWAGQQRQLGGVLGGCPAR